MIYVSAALEKRFISKEACKQFWKEVFVHRGHLPHTKQKIFLFYEYLRLCASVSAYIYIWATYMKPLTWSSNIEIHLLVQSHTKY